MSSIKLESNASGTGVFTIASPNSNTNRTLTLPDATGTIITTAGGAAISGTTGTFTGLVDISAAGAGQIQFPATQNASSNANTLDDYEEGTWTPGFAFGGNAVGITYASGTTGTYTKIGRMVTVIANVALSNKGSSTGNATVTGLPFTSASGEPYSGIAFANVSFITFVEGIVGSVDGTAINLREILSASGGTALTNSDFDNQGQVRFTASYFV